MLNLFLFQILSKIFFRKSQFLENWNLTKKSVAKKKWTKFTDNFEEK